MKNHPKKYHSVFISPHVDDVIFSCGGTIAEISRKENLLIVYVFSDYGKNTVSRKFEEEKVSKNLGYETLFLDLPDFPQRYRFGFLPFSHHRSFQKKKDQKWLVELMDLLKTNLDAIEYDQIYFPLGSGMHLDHEICFRAGLEKIGSDKVFFYEDLPYSFVPGLLFHRLQFLSKQHFLNDAGIFPTSEEKIENLPDSILEYLLTDPFFTRTGLVKMKTVLKFFLKPYLKYCLKKIENRAGDFQFDFQNLQLDIQKTFDLKMSGIRCYQSQIRHFFNSLQEMEKRYKAFHSKSIQLKESFFERFWYITS